MSGLRFDTAQRFTCQQCGRCCRRGWEIVALAPEVESYRRHGAARWFRESDGSVEGSWQDPFERIRGRVGYFRIRKRPDGACGFLSPENRCRIHEELGEAAKPLTCRAFPFRFHPAESEDVVSVSFSCPTVVANTGTRLMKQGETLRRLRRQWLDGHPEPPRPATLAGGRPLGRGALTTLREVLGGLLSRPGPDGAPDLRSNLVRMGRLLDDLTRQRVRKLNGDRFEEYLKLTGGFAVASDKPVPLRPPSRLGRLLQRGFVFAVLAAEAQRRDGRTSGPRLSLRWELARLLAHAHGVGGPVGDVDLGLARLARVRLEHEGVRALVLRHLEGTLATLGTGRFAVLDELALAVSYLNAAGVLGAMAAARADEPEVSAERFAAGLLEASDLAHADDRGLLGRFLTTFAGGTEALYVLASGGAGPSGKA